MTHPGVYVTDEEGVVLAKFFQDTYKKRDSSDRLIAPHRARLMLRKVRKYPLGWPRLVLKTIGLEIAAKRRRSRKRD